jgi:hypothetical protein
MRVLIALYNLWKDDINSQQEELCCDFMAGVRAGLNGMDEGKIILVNLSKGKI